VRKIFISAIVSVIVLVLAFIWEIALIHPDEERELHDRVKLKVLVDALELYKESVGVYPSTNSGLKTLIPEYLDIHLLDSWGQPIKYINSGGSVSLTALGKDGKVGGMDLNQDIVAEIEGI